LNCVGKTFHFTPEGQVGLVQNKKVVVLNARGSNYSEGVNVSSEMAVNFVLKNLQLFGITDITTIIVEGHSQQPARRDAIIQSGIECAIRAAKAF
jgi:FMN-dependent NADH-azoreductase